LKNQRKDIIGELDDQDRFWIERRGPEELQPNFINPHRVQIFSFEEIWKGILARLVELKVLRDPDDMVEEAGDDDDSTEYEDWEYANASEEPTDSLGRPKFDFIRAARKRFGKLFRGQPSARKGKSRSLEEQMKRNDFIMINKALLKVAEHEAF